MEQCNNKTNKLDEINKNSYEIHVKFVQFAKKESKHTSKHTLQSHGHVIDHAPAFEHLGDRHAGAVLTRCQHVVGRPGDMAKWIFDSASTLPPLQTSIWCTLPTKKSMQCSPTSMTARQGSWRHNSLHNVVAQPLPPR